MLMLLLLLLLLGLQDMRLLVSNCKQYNPTPTDPVRLAVLRLGEVFEQQWIASGLCAEAQRAKRANAGIAAPKFEPEEYDGMAGGPKPHRSGGDKRPPVSCWFSYICACSRTCTGFEMHSHYCSICGRVADCYIRFGADKASPLEI